MAGGAGPARRYATALFSIAKERGTADAWVAELQRLAAALSDASTMRILSGPSIGIRQKQESLEKAAGPLSREVRSLLAILIERKRLTQIPALAEAFADLIREAKGIDLADVTTAVPLSDADRQSVNRWLIGYLGHAVEVRYHIDPDIIGGVVARIGDQLIDASVRSRLETLRKMIRSA